MEKRCGLPIHGGSYGGPSHEQEGPINQSLGNDLCDSAPPGEEKAESEEPKPKILKGPEIKSQNGSKKPLWAISRGRRGKVAHRVGRASWGLPISEWTTICGWHFAKANNKVELTRFKELSIQCCQKCRDLHSLRDGVKGGVELAQLVEI